MIRQIELDADQEILRLKLRYEKQLKEEREASSRLKVCPALSVAAVCLPAPLPAVCSYHFILRGRFCVCGGYARVTMASWARN
jgi:hypothetical protein